MWKLFNFLFRFDYIFWKNSCDQGIARVYKNKDGFVFYFRYRITNLIDVIEDEQQVLFLTCSSKKYFKS